MAVSKNGVQNMLKMVWDPEVAKIAQRWAENCKTEHDGNRERFIPGEFKLTCIEIQDTHILQNF